MAQTETRKELIDKFDFLIEFENEHDMLSIWETDFLDSIESNLKAEDGFLTDLQIEKLEQIYDKYSE